MEEKYPLQLDAETVEKNEEQLYNYADMRKELNRLIASSTGNTKGMYEEMLQVLDLSAEWVNGDDSLYSELSDSVYFILS